MTCSRCGKAPRCPGQRWCRPCFNRYRRKTRRKYADLSDEERRRTRCRSYTNALIRRGVLTRGPCRKCDGTTNVEAHHDDYDKPREVHWLCRICHWAMHTAARQDTALTESQAFYARWASA